MRAGGRAPAAPEPPYCPPHHRERMRAAIREGLDRLAAQTEAYAAKRKAARGQ